MCDAKNNADGALVALAYFFLAGGLLVICWPEVKSL